MADQLYLSLWFPNFRFSALPETLAGVLRQFATVSGDKRVAAASAYPLGFTESPTYQRLYVNDDRSETGDESSIESAVAEATEQLHEDMAYEFEMKWNLWSPTIEDTDEGLEAVWKEQPSTVRIMGFGPQFDDASFDQNGHIRVDFGLDTPWILDDEALEAAGSSTANSDAAATYIQKNVEMLLAFTLLVERHCGISSRLLWTESGEPLVQKLIDRLQRVN
ncbi:hypothetical protein [Granulicella aggregans]|jgi:hypothetical protein|uniref:hypothetical protein n=1 Tax=Granulicella aggregans TaxID=474949 RepID=UPI0021E06F78|nr:hypothetical protein [Granulicella aggregans]